MKVIGVYLSFSPKIGGTYQYCLSILNALKLVNNNDIKVVVFYTKREWIKELDKFSFKHIIINDTYLFERIFLILLSLKINIRILRWIFPKINNLPKEIKITTSMT